MSENSATLASLHRKPIADLTEEEIDRLNAENRRKRFREEAAMRILPALIAKPIDDQAMAMQALKLEDHPASAVQLADMLWDALQAPPPEPIDLAAELEKLLYVPDDVPSPPSTAPDLGAVGLAVAVRS